MEISRAAPSVSTINFNWIAWEAKEKKTNKKTAQIRIAKSSRWWNNLPIANWNAVECTSLIFPMMIQ